MNTEDNRRGFLGSVVFGIPLLAAGSAAAFAQSFHAGEHAGAPSGATDPVLEHIEQQFVALLDAARRRGTGIEPDEARRAVTYLQVLGVHGHTVGLDDRARRAMQARIDARGRDAVIRAPLDLRHVRHTLAIRGIDIPDRVVTALASQSMADRTTAIDTILGGKTSAVFTQVASVVDSVIPRPDGQGARPVSYSPDGTCDFYQWQMMWYFAIATGFCTSVSGDPYLDGWCVTMWSSALVAESLYWSGC